MNEPVTFTWDKGRVRLIAAGAALTALVGIIMIVQDDWGSKIFGVVWIATLLALVLVLLRRARSRDPVVRIDAQGILDRRISDQVIPWDDIKSVGALEAEQVTFVGIDLKSDARVFASLHPIHRVMRLPNRLLRFPALSIAMHALDGSSADVVAAIHRFRPDLVQEP